MDQMGDAYQIVCVQRGQLVDQGVERRGEPGDAQRIAGQSTPLKSRDVYCYFDNDIKVRAPFDARSLIDKLGLSEGLVPFSWHARP